MAFREVGVRMGGAWIGFGIASNFGFGINGFKLSGSATRQKVKN
jgi:hypothetical protein